MALPGAGPISVVHDQRIWWEDTINQVNAALDAGVPARKLIDTIDMEQYQGYRSYSRWRMNALFRRLASLYITGR